MRSPDMLAVNSVVELSEYVRTKYTFYQFTGQGWLLAKRQGYPILQKHPYKTVVICIGCSMRSIAYFDPVSDDHMQGLGLVQCLPCTKHISDNEQLVSLLSDNHDQVILSRRLQPF